MQQKLSEGNITKKILLFALPILIGNAMQRAYTLADTVMVGRLLGTNELAAVGAASVIANFFNDICNSFTSGFAIIVAQFFGAGDEKRMKKSLAATYTLIAALAVILISGGNLLIKPILTLTQVPSEIFASSTAYLRIMVSGLIASIIYNSLANLLRSLGDSTIPLIFLIVSVSLNIVLDYTFIAIFGWGVKGAAGATIVSQAIAGCGCLIFCLFKRKILAVKTEHFRENKEIYGALIPQGLSMCFMISLVSLSTVILQAGINSLGSDVIAGYLAGRKYLELFMMPGAALSMTSAPFVSQNYGAKRLNRIKSGVFQLYVIAWIWSAIAFVIIFVFGRALVMSVTGSSVSEEIITSGVLYLRIGICLFPPLQVLVITRSALQGMNHKKTPVISSIMEVLVKILAVAFFVPRLGFMGICITEPIIWVLGALWLYPNYRILLKKETAALQLK